MTTADCRRNRLPRASIEALGYSSSISVFSKYHAGSSGTSLALRECKSVTLGIEPVIPSIHRSEFGGRDSNPDSDHTKVEVRPRRSTSKTGFPNSDSGGLKKMW